MSRWSLPPGKVGPVRRAYTWWAARWCPLALARRLADQVWPKPIDISGWGTPEGQPWGYAPIGSICRDGQTGAVYRKAGPLGTAITNTGWAAM